MDSRRSMLDGAGFNPLPSMSWSSISSSHSSCFLFIFCLSIHPLQPNPAVRLLQLFEYVLLDNNELFPEIFVLVVRWGWLRVPALDLPGTNGPISPGMKCHACPNIVRVHHYTGEGWDFIFNTTLLMPRLG
jgi:hypothetical protein